LKQTIEKRPGYQAGIVLAVAKNPPSGRRRALSDNAGQTILETVLPIRKLVQKEQQPK